MKLRTARPRPSRAAARRLLPLLLAPALLPAGAADRVWSGGAGSGSPYWDLPANWLSGPPRSDADRALLGAFDTTARSGSYRALELRGSGALNFGGSAELHLKGGGSTLRTLDLGGGWIDGPGTLTVQNLRWSGGSLAPRVFDAATFMQRPRLVVTGDAVLDGPQAGRGDFYSQLQILGTARWNRPGTAGFDGLLHIGAGGTMLDDEREVRAVSFGNGFVNDGRYLKRGPGSSAVSAAFGGSRFVNNGLIDVQAGSFSTDVQVGGTWINTGTIELQGRSMSGQFYRLDTMEQSGTVNLRNGTAGFDIFRTQLESRGDWNIARGTQLSFVGSAGYDLDQPLHFAAGHLRNEGTLVFRGGSIRISAGVLGGGGTLRLLQAAGLNVAGALDLGALEIAEPVPQDFAPPVASGLVVDGALSVGRLVWREGGLRTGGPVSVNGPTLLSDGIYLYEPDGSFAFYKPVGQAMRFNGDVRWEGGADMRGAGEFLLAAGRVFEDRVAQTLLDYDPTLPQCLPCERGPRIGLARFVNEGTYLKTGPVASEIRTPLDNRGIVRAVDAGRLTLSGPLSNRGGIEAVRSRIELAGALAGWDAASGTLAGGRYLMRDGSIVLAFGGPRAQVRHNRAAIVLDGPEAALLAGEARGPVERPVPAGTLPGPALATLARNSGELQLLNGATLALDGPLRQQGLLVVEGNSVLDVGDAFVQDGARAASWIDGWLVADSFSLLAGRFGAGAPGAAGLALLGGGDVRLDGATLVFDLAAPQALDRLHAEGALRLGGLLELDFGFQPAVGSRWRLITAEHGIQGRFDRLALAGDSNAHGLELIYGVDHVDLRVIASVPEPGTWALLALGLAGLAARQRRRGRGAPR